MSNCDSESVGAGACMIIIALIYKEAMHII